MSNLKHIVFRIANSQVGEDGRFKQASVHAVGGTLVSDTKYQKAMSDLIAHALTLTSGEIVENQCFTYTFPFKMA